MLIRPAPAQRSLFFSRSNLLTRPRLPPRCLTSQTLPSRASQRLLVTRPDSVPWRRKGCRAIGAYIPERSLATAMDDPRLRLEDVSFDGITSSMSPSYSQPTKQTQLYHIRPTASPLLVVDPYEDEPFPKLRISSKGVPGDLGEMVSIYDACLRVDQLGRAALVLARLSETNALNGHDMIDLHNRYLRAHLERVFVDPDAKRAEGLQQWYEVHIRGKGLPQTAETVACMLKISLISARGSRLARMVNRYMGMMPGAAGLEVLSMADILTDEDLAKITRICPMYNLSPEDWITEIDAPAQASLEPLNSETQDTTPEVMSTPQKGLGLKTLKETLSLFTEIQGHDISSLPLEERKEIQARLERDCVDAAINRWREEHQALLKMGLNSNITNTSLNSRLYEWHSALEVRLKDEFSKFEESETRSEKTAEDLDRCLYAPFLRQSNPVRLAAVTILSALNVTATAGVDKAAPVANMVSSLAKNIEDDCKAYMKQQASKHLSKSRKRRTFNQQKTPEPKQPVELKEASKSNIVNPQQYEHKSWPVAIKAKIGAVLLSAFLDSAKVTAIREHPDTKALVSQQQPAMTHTSILRRGKKSGVIMPNKILVDLLKTEPRAEYLATHLPMVVEPEPWTKFDKGGFLAYPSAMVRIKHGERDQKIYTEAAFDRGDMEQVSKGLDVLGRTAWRVNRPILKVMLDAWNTGKGIAGLPPVNPALDLPQEPDSTEDPFQRRLWLKALKAVENEKSGLHSQRCFTNFQLEIARALKDQTFYFPHNVDFRGRAYPIPPYLNHMGADHVRGLLRFGKGKELGERGLRWLKIHLANVYGYDKASFAERESFAMENLTNVFESANKPLDGSKWWMRAEDPWQCLATCFELKAALESADPTKFVSHLPVHQDGTCNGLQHYAALGGDTWGAQQVNLEPGERPADVYSAVADLVKKSITEDVARDHTIAKYIDGKITRKVVKQTVMTNVYGVTYIGAKAQVQKQLDDAHPELEKQTGISSAIFSSYIATKIFSALADMFRGAHDIQFWLGECAGRVCKALTPEQLDRIVSDQASKSTKSRKGKKTKKLRTSIDDLLEQFRSTIVWTTPLRMPIVQPYRKTGARVVRTSLQALSLLIPDRSDPVNSRKQLQGFPPNFIHSLDASHMLLSALECDERGLTFAAVHDSFWTHAGDVDEMSDVLRDAFIRIHSDDVIGRLAAEFEARYKGSLYLTKIPASSPAGEKIQLWRAHSKLSLREELFAEHERTRLLNSADPEEVEKGRKMETPGSIFEEMSAEQPLTASEEMAEVGLGNILPESKAEALEKFIEASEVEGAESLPEVAAVDNNEPAMPGYSESGLFKAALTKEKKSRQGPKSNNVTTQLWLPLSFPPIPKKGDFDVSRLKSSKYFFS